jgi:hypothetical protein
MPPALTEGDPLRRAARSHVAAGAPLFAPSVAERGGALKTRADIMCIIGDGPIPSAPESEHTVVIAQTRFRVSSVSVASMVKP